MIRCTRTAAVLLTSVLALAACTEKPQTATVKKVDGKAWEGPASPYTAPGWKQGDEASWEQQMRARAQEGQNDYSRAK